MTPLIEAPNVAHLKDHIDSGRSGDKVGGFDPAAAPLGTDDEAGGAPLSPEAVQLALAQERSPGAPTATANGAEPDLQPNGSLSPASPLLPAITGGLVGLGLVILGAVFLL